MSSTNDTRVDRADPGLEASSRPAVALDIPRDLYGRRERDRMWRGFRNVASLYERLSRVAVRKRPTPQGKSHDLEVCISARTPVANGVMSIELTSGLPLPGWRPGSHIDVLLPCGLVRQYSLCSSPRNLTHYRIAVRQVGPGSTELQSLPAGTPLTIRLPRNAFPLITAQDYLFVAGGIGITAILPMIEAVQEAGASYSVVYTGRSPAFLPELARFGDRVSVANKRVEPSIAQAGTVVYCCGPADMIAAWRANTPGLFFAERFAPPTVVNGRPFEITLARAGVTLTIPKDRSALSVIRDVLPSVAYSCQQGFCGTCRVGDVLLCIDRAEDHIVVDL